MSICLEDLAHVRRGTSDSLQIGEIPQHIMRAMNWRLPYVYLNGKALRHIVEDHDDMSEVDVLLLPFAIQYGLLMREHKRPTTLISAYQHPTIEKRRYKVAIKSMDDGLELWIATQHTLRPRQTRSLMARSEILQRHR